MIYLDANFFIFALLDKTEKGKNARRILKEIIDGRLDAVISPLVLDEVMWVLVKNKKDHLLRIAVEDIYAMPNLKVKEVSPDIPLIALDFIEKFRLKPRDAFHVAMMKRLGVKEIVTDDKDFDVVEWVKRIAL